MTAKTSCMFVMASLCTALSATARAEPPPEPEPVVLGEGMSKPEFPASGVPAFKWPKAALANHVEGVILTRCVVTTAGTLKDCTITKRLPHVEDAAVLDWLAQWKGTPAMRDGRPVALKDYSLPLRLKLP